MKLVVAEKPSVMRDIAAVLGAAQKTADGSALRQRIHSHIGERTPWSG